MRWFAGLEVFVMTINIHVYVFWQSKPDYIFLHWPQQNAECCRKRLNIDWWWTICSYYFCLPANLQSHIRQAVDANNIWIPNTSILASILHIHIYDLLNFIIHFGINGIYISHIFNDFIANLLRCLLGWLKELFIPCSSNAPMTKARPFHRLPFLPMTIYRK